MAIGIFVVPLLKEFMMSGNEGIKYPIPIPNAIAIKIQSVRNLSRKLNFLLDPIVVNKFERKHKVGIRISFSVYG